MLVNKFDLLGKNLVTLGYSLEVYLNFVEFGMDFLLEFEIGYLIPELEL